MNRLRYTGTVKSAELCTPLEGVRVRRTSADGKMSEETSSDRYGNWSLEDFYTGDEMSFSARGFVTKTYHTRKIPELVRLLEDRLIGYQKRLWFLPGESIKVYVHSPQKYSAKLFRHGFGKESILNLGFFEAQCQNIPDDYFVERGLDWKESSSYNVPQNARPGLYSLLLESNGQEPFAIPMVVSTAEENHGKNARILVLAGTNTWQSYNLWGGRSRYRNFEENNTEDFIFLHSKFSSSRISVIVRFLLELPTKISKKVLRKQKAPPNWMFKKLSIRRPFTNCCLEDDNPFQPFTNHLAAAEWRLLAWLEREKYNYDIVSGYELHANPDLVKNYNAIVLNTHCEYWTAQMFRGLKVYHEEKQGWILNISGNSIFREIEFFNDGSTRCVSLSFKDSCEDESNILGVRFSMSDYATCAPYKIRKPDHWIFSGIPISKSNNFGGLSLNQNTKKRFSRYDPGRPGIEAGLDGMGASGWETDKKCRTAPNDIKVVAKGLNPMGGADMVVRDPDGSRGGMFSASSLLFSGCLLIDNVASQIVKNVLIKALNQNEPD